MTLIPVQITFRGLAHSPALKADIRERIAWLHQFHSDIMRCRVVVEIRHRRRHAGRHVYIRVELTVANSEPIVVSHAPSLHGRLRDLEEATHHKETDIDSVHRHARATIHEAFDAARGRLEDSARERRGAVKAHAPEAVVEEQGEKST